LVVLENALDDYVKLLLYTTLHNRTELRHLSLGTRRGEPVEKLALAHGLATLSHLEHLVVLQRDLR
jgi:hypothetical protein